MKLKITHSLIALTLIVSSCSGKIELGSQIDSVGRAAVSTSRFPHPAKNTEAVTKIASRRMAIRPVWDLASCRAVPSVAGAGRPKAARVGEYHGPAGGLSI